MDKRLKINWCPYSNFGDSLNPYYLKKSGVPFIWTHHTIAAKIGMIGSILSYISQPKSIVWGAGHAFLSQGGHKDTIYKAVRGPNSLKRLKQIGANVSNTLLGDPGLLLPRIYNPAIVKQYKLGIIPHIADYAIYGDYVTSNKSKFENTLLIDPNKPCRDVEKFIDQVLSCEKIVSTCLHGIVCADAYQIPVVWSKIGDRLAGGEYKFIDYYESFGIHSPRKIEFVESEQISIDRYDTSNLDLEGLWNARPWIDNLSEDYFVDVSVSDWRSHCYPSDYNYGDGDRYLFSDERIKCT